MKGNLSAPHDLTYFLNIETWKYSPIVLIPIFHAGKDILYVPTKLKLFLLQPSYREYMKAIFSAAPRLLALPHLSTAAPLRNA